MKPKKGHLVLLSLSIALLFPFSASAAGNGQWNYVGYSKFYNASVVVYSTGGDFMACLLSGPSGYYQLREQDPGFEDDNIGTIRYMYPGDCEVWRDINFAVDGTNNKAEFYLAKASGTDSSTQAYVEFYD